MDAQLKAKRSKSMTPQVSSYAPQTAHQWCDGFEGDSVLLPPGLFVMQRVLVY